MLSLDNAFPCGERSAWLKGHADKKLLESYRHACEVIREGGGQVDNLSSALSKVTDNLSGNKHLSAAAYAAHSRLIDEIRENNLDAVNGLMSALEPEMMLTSHQEISPQGSARNNPVVQKLFDTVMSDQHVNEYKVVYDASPPTSKAYESSKASLIKVGKALNNYDPETAKEISHLVTDYLIIDSKEINAGTSFKVHGLILLRSLNKERAWTTYLENVVHETAHLNLFYTWVHDPIFKSDPMIKKRSPLRKSDRPLSGIYHAAYVLARTVRAIKVFREIPEFEKDIETMSTSYNYLKNPDSFEKKFDDACTELKSATFTDTGKAILESCAEMVHG